MTKIEKTNRGIKKLSTITTIVALISILMYILQSVSYYIDHDILSNIVNLYDNCYFGFFCYILTVIPVFLFVLSIILTALESKAKGNLKPFKTKTFIVPAVSVAIVTIAVLISNIVNEYLFMTF